MDAEAEAAVVMDAEAEAVVKDTAIKVHLKFWNEHVSASVSRVSGARGNS